MLILYAMQPILVKDRKTGQIIEEQVFGDFAVKLLYGNSSSILREFLSKNPFVSRFYGWWQRGFWTKSSIQKFIQKYGLNTAEFEKQDFASFDEFFTRHLKEECRPLAFGDKVAVMPADARYRFFPSINGKEIFSIKGRGMALRDLLQDEILAEQFEGGSMVIARLCPVDYHRFHFPLSGKASPARLIPGPLYSVNPWALCCQPSILCENKRMVTTLENSHFGKVAYIEVGATCVGSIHQTYEANKIVAKGQEKGYFSFGGSCLILLFEKDRISFDADLCGSSLEIYCQMGQSLGQALNK